MNTPHKMGLMQRKKKFNKEDELSHSIAGESMPERQQKKTVLLVQERRKSF